MLRAHRKFEAQSSTCSSTVDIDLVSATLNHVLLSLSISTGYSVHDTNYGETLLLCGEISVREQYLKQIKNLCLRLWVSKWGSSTI